MPRYGESQYGLFQYGIYELDGSESGFKPELGSRMRMRMHTKDGGIGLWVETQGMEAPIDKPFPKIRIKTQDGHWIYQQHVILPTTASKVRIRARQGEETHPWVLYEEARIGGKL